MVPTAAPVAVETNSRRVTPCSVSLLIGAVLPKRLLDDRRRYDLDDGLEARGLLSSLGVEEARGSSPGVVLHRHARRKGHRFFLEPGDVELMHAGLFVNQLPFLLQHRLV